MWEHYHPYSERLLDQMKYWVWKGGRPDHSGNAHDDNIMAMAIALFNVADGIKKIRNENDAFFFDENGNAITMKEQSSSKMVDNYFNSREDKGKTLDESVYKAAERKMYADAGINPNDENASETYRWLLS